VRSARWLGWLVLAVGALYFIVPLLATVRFSLDNPGQSPFAAYTGILGQSGFWHGLGFSLAASIGTVAVAILVVVPAVYWSRFKAPKVHAWIEMLSLLSFVVPPIVLVFGVVGLYSTSIWPLTTRGVMLIGAYAIMSLPYMFRAIDNGLSSLNATVLTEAAQSLGASWWYLLARVIVPNLRTAMLGGAFLTLALVMGEYAVASMLGFNNLGVYMLTTGQTQAQGAAALAVIGFLAVWAAIVTMHYLSGKDVTIGGGAR
jgi:putative spermidine/putrescine transport system permease protein